MPNAQLKAVPTIEYLRLALKIDPYVGGYTPSWKRPLPAIDAFTKRNELVRRFSWAIPSEEALSAILAHGPVLEIGAGGGYWAMLLAERGGDVVAFDEKPHKNTWVDCNWFPVQQGDQTVAASHADRTLFLCWPYMNEMADDAVRLYRGSTVAYIGEGEGGCTASDEFFDRMEADWEEAESVVLPQWVSIHDRLTIYRRKTPVRTRKIALSTQAGDDI